MECKLGHIMHTAMSLCSGILWRVLGLNFDVNNPLSWCSCYTCFNFCYGFLLSFDGFGCYIFKSQVSRSDYKIYASIVPFQVRVVWLDRAQSSRRWQLSGSCFVFTSFCAYFSCFSCTQLLLSRTFRFMGCYHFIYNREIIYYWCFLYFFV